MSRAADAAPPPPPPPPPGGYPATTVQLGTNTTIAPDAMPIANTKSINVSTSTNFKGLLEADPITGIVRVTNAHPAGNPAGNPVGTYTLAVTGFDADGNSISSKSLMLTVKTPATCNPVAFAAKADTPAGTNPRSVAIGDFNRDHIQDLAIASAPDKVWVLLGKETGGFDAPLKFSVGITPNSVAVGDFNGDGNQDLVTANSNFASQNVSVLLGDGTGGFSDAVNFGVDGQPRSVAMGDFNGDHKQDLAVTNEVSATVSILLGAGDGSFGAAIRIDVDSFPYWLAVGDFDDDGRPDLAVTRRSPANTVMVLLNTTNPFPLPGVVTFSPATPFDVGGDPLSVTVGNFNEDASQDLATANQANGSNVSVLLGDEGNFNPVNPRDYLAGDSPQSVAVGDFDGNLTQDLAVANAASNDFSILLGRGNGIFDPLPSVGAGSNPDSVVVGDFNGDGMQDLAIANYSSDSVSVILRQCCPPVITHSSSQAITAANSVSCNLGGGPGAFHMNNSYWRAFDMAVFTSSQPSQPYHVTSVSFGIETAHAGGPDPTQAVTVNLYTQTTGTFPNGTRTSLISLPVMVPDQTQTIFNVPLETTVAAGTSELIMEVFTPNGQIDRNSFFVGSNPAPETGPSYVSAESCGITMPTTTTALGFPNMHIVFNIHGSCVGSTGATETINLSTRLQVQTGNNIAIGGFIIKGSLPKHVLIRAIGPSLSGFGVPGALQDPMLELHGPGAFGTITNDNWRSTQEAEIRATGIPPIDDRESAVDVILDPGAYTAVVRGVNNTSGVALVEAYDLDQGTDSNLANISTRGFVSTGDNIVIAGFTLGNGHGDNRIAVRGIGPSLAAFGIAGALADPTLELRDSNGALQVANNDWQDNSAQAAELAAAGLAPTNQLESGLVATLPPGAYTALLAGLDNGTGVGLVEVYDLGTP